MAGGGGRQPNAPKAPALAHPERLRYFSASPPSSRVGNNQTRGEGGIASSTSGGRALTLCVVGALSGKTQLLQRYLRDQFRADYESTLYDEYQCEVGGSSFGHTLSES